MASRGAAPVAPAGLESLGLFGQLVIGPPGSGKTTYCNAMVEFLTSIGRKAFVVNLDPANDFLPYSCAVDIRDLIRLHEVMQSLRLGPNGGLVYCIDYVYTNRDWLAEQLTTLKRQHGTPYIIFDCPGQVELYTHHPSMRHLVSYLTCKVTSCPPADGLGLSLSAVHLVDSHYCSDPGKFISCLLTSLSTMLQLSLPHVNVLSKADLVEAFGELAFNLDFFTEVLNLDFLVDVMTRSDESSRDDRYTRLNRALVGLIQDHSLVQFIILDIQSRSDLERVMRHADKANGYVFGPTESHNLQAMMQVASGLEASSDYVGLIQEKYMSNERKDTKIDFFE